MCNEEKVKIHPARETVHRWNNYLSFLFKISESVAFTAAVYVQPRFDDFNDVRVLEESILSFKITKYLSFDAIFNLRYDSRPPDNVKDLDLALVNGFSVRF